MRYLLKALPIFILLLFSTLIPFPTLAHAKDDLENIINGFDEETQTKKPQQEQSIESIIEGYEDEKDSNTGTTAGPQSSSAYSLDGYLKLGATWNFAHRAPEPGETDWRRLSRLRPEARIDLDADLTKSWRFLIGTKSFYDFAYTLKGRDEFSGEVLDAYEYEVELAEAYVQGRLGRSCDIKAGRQIVVWGRSDNIRITDVLNPLDLREPGLTDIEDLRLPVAMTRVDGYWGAWNLSTIALHEIRFDKTTVFGHDFFPGRTPLPDEDRPRCGGKNTEWALALNGIFSGKDISFYWANLFDDKTNTAIDSQGRLIREHARVSLWGAAGNLALGNWLVKSEAAYWQGLKFLNTEDEKFTRLDWLLGVEYTGWHETTVSLDWAIRHTFGFDRRLTSEPDFAQEDAFQSALRITRNFFNETMDITLLAMIYGPLGQDGALERLTMSYDWNDLISTTFGMVLYQSGDSIALSQVDENDRFFAEIKYSF